MQDLVITHPEQLKEINARLERIERQLESITNSRPDDYLTTDEVCEILKISKPTLNRRKAKGEIQFHRIGGLIRYKRSEVMEAAKLAKVK